MGFDRKIMGHPIIKAQEITKAGTKAGFLVKYDPFTTAWERFYCVIKPSTFLYLYNSDTDKKPTGVVDLEFYTDITCSSDEIYLAPDPDSRVADKLDTLVLGPDESMTGDDKAKSSAQLDWLDAFKEDRFAYVTSQRDNTVRHYENQIAEVEALAKSHHVKQAKKQTESLAKTMAEIRTQLAHLLTLCPSLSRGNLSPGAMSEEGNDDDEAIDRDQSIEALVEMLQNRLITLSEQVEAQRAKLIVWKEKGQVLMAEKLVLETEHEILKTEVQVLENIKHDDRDALELEKEALLKAQHAFRNEQHVLESEKNKQKAAWEQEKKALSTEKKALQSEKQFLEAEKYVQKRARESEISGMATEKEAQSHSLQAVQQRLEAEILALASEKQAFEMEKNTHVQSMSVNQKAVTRETQALASERQALAVEQERHKKSLNDLTQALEMEKGALASEKQAFELDIQTMTSVNQKAVTRETQALASERQALAMEQKRHKKSLNDLTQALEIEKGALATEKQAFEKKKEAHEKQRASLVHRADATRETEKLALMTEKKTLHMAHLRHVQTIATETQALATEKRMIEHEQQVANDALTTMKQTLAAEQHVQKQALAAEQHVQKQTLAAEQHVQKQALATIKQVLATEKQRLVFDQQVQTQALEARIRAFESEKLTWQRQRRTSDATPSHWQSKGVGWLKMDPSCEPSPYSGAQSRRRAATVSSMYDVSPPVMLERSPPKIPMLGKSSPDMPMLPLPETALSRTHPPRMSPTRTRRPSAAYIPPTPEGALSDLDKSEMSQSDLSQSDLSDSEMSDYDSPILSPECGGMSPTETPPLKENPLHPLELLEVIGMDLPRVDLEPSFVVQELSKSPESPESKPFRRSASAPVPAQSLLKSPVASPTQTSLFGRRFSLASIKRNAIRRMSSAGQGGR